MKPLLNVENLCVDYITLDSSIRAVDNVSFGIGEEESLGLAGESGCGKSTIAYSLMRLHRPPAIISGGTIELDGQSILDMDSSTLQKFRWDRMSMVFQSAMNCLNPVARLDKQFFDIFKYHDITKNRKEADQRAVELLKLVDIPPDRLKNYPHQFSGGMRQRAVIAMALSLNPRLLILDEPTTALDTVVQREILEKIYELKKQYKFSILFITHDLSLMMEFCDKIAIMYAGKIAEMAPAKRILAKPGHPYTFGLNSSFPSLQGEIKEMQGIAGSPLDLRNVPAGCRFQSRCFRAGDKCKTEEPKVDYLAKDFVACHYPLDAGHSEGPEEQRGS